MATLEELQESYSRALYRIDADPEPIVLRAGEPSPQLDRWLAARGAKRFAFLTAANPGSEPLTEAENARRYVRLLARVRETGLRTIAGESCEATSGGWRERSLLVVGIDREPALALARELGQLALLVGEIGGPVELLYTSSARGAAAGG